jgi:hypothetical protein
MTAVVQVDLLVIDSAAAAATTALLTTGTTGNMYVAQVSLWCTAVQYSVHSDITYIRTAF